MKSTSVTMSTTGFPSSSKNTESLNSRLEIRLACRSEMLSQVGGALTHDWHSELHATLDAVVKQMTGVMGQPAHCCQRSMTSMLKPSDFVRV